MCVYVCVCACVCVCVMVCGVVGSGMCAGAGGEVVVVGGVEGREGGACGDGNVVLLVVIVLEMVVLLRLHVVIILHVLLMLPGAVHGEVAIQKSIAVV